MKFGNLEQNILVIKLEYWLFWDKTDKLKTLVLATHGFIKKVGKVPKKEIEKAKRIRIKYFENKLKK